MFGARAFLLLPTLSATAALSKLGLRATSLHDELSAVGARAAGTAPEGGRDARRRCRRLPEVQACEEEMSWCTVHSPPLSSSERQECTAIVEEKFRLLKSSSYSAAVTRGNHSDADAGAAARVTEAMRNDYYDRCSEACGDGVDSSCVPECENDMYQCVDHMTSYNMSIEEDRKMRAQCQDKVIEDYKGWGTSWDESHPHLSSWRRDGGWSLQTLSGEIRQAMHVHCQLACGVNPDPDTMQQCETELIFCVDYAEQGGQQACLENVTEKYKKLDSAQHTHELRELSHRRNNSEGRDILSAAVRQGFYNRCQKACGKGADSSCVPQCETEMYWCVDHMTTHDFDIDYEPERETCLTSVEEKYKDFQDDWEESHPNLLRRRFAGSRGGRLAGGPAAGAEAEELRALSGELRRMLRWRCRAACRDRVDARGVPRCETRMYWCVDRTTEETARAIARGHGADGDDGGAGERCLKGIEARCRKLEDGLTGAHLRARGRDDRAAARFRQELDDLARQAPVSEEARADFAAFAKGWGFNATAWKFSM